ncbi:MAG: efflux transporter outer membrane subunit [Desulforhopalus sp.]
MQATSDITTTTHRLNTIIGLLLLTGCTVHEVDTSPQPLVDTETSYSIASSPNAPTNEVWWAAFNDPELDVLIRSGLANSFDILQAFSRLNQAQALSQQARAVLLPQINVFTDSIQGWREGNERESISRLGADFTWEVDIFDRLGSFAMARQSEQQARRDEVDAVRLRLSAEIAQTYFDAVGWRLQLALLGNQIETDKNLLELTQLRFDSGLTARVDVLQQASQLADTESLVPAIESALRVSENRLDVLLGSSPDGRDRVTAGAAFIDIGSLPFIGVPADLLLQRPDLRALRNELIAADAQIGQAIAERFPRVTLDGSFLYEDGLDPGGVVARMVASFVQPLVDWGVRKAEIQRNRALYVERLALFTQQFLVAIEDVENALYLERQQRELLRRLDHRRTLLRRTVEETTMRYTNGLTDYLPVLDAVKELQRLERVIIQQERALLSFRIRLHRALGGSLGQQR